MGFCDSSDAEKMSFDLQAREITVNWPSWVSDMEGYFSIDLAYYIDHYQYYLNEMKMRSLIVLWVVSVQTEANLYLPVK